MNNLAILPQPRATSTMSGKHKPSASYIHAIGLCKTYPARDGGVVYALKDVNLDIQAGEFLSILGPSGCGKSTLLKCIAGLEPISAGTLRVEGAAVTKPPKKMGVVFQRDLLLDWRTVIDNILIQAEFQNLNPADYRERAVALLAMFDLANFASRFPWQLSGGQRQRVAICRALLTDPELLLMDEPFGALDAMTRDELNFELQRMWIETKKTVVFITHSISEAIYLGDRVVTMSRNPGQIASTLEINIPRMRDLAVRQTPKFGEYTEEVRTVFRSLGIFK